MSWQSPLFEQDRNIKKNFGYETFLSTWKRTDLFEIKKRLFEQLNVCNLM